MAKSTVISVSIPEDMGKMVKAIAEKEGGLSRWFQEKVRQYGGGVDLDAVDASLKEVSEKLDYVTRCVDRLKKDRGCEFMDSNERVDLGSEEVF